MAAGKVRQPVEDPRTWLDMEATLPVMALALARTCLERLERAYGVAQADGDQDSQGVLSAAAARIRAKIAELEAKGPTQGLAVPRKEDRKPS